jgi:hypothetical protein
MKKTTLFLILLILSSCSASWHLKKALKKQPDIILCDTVITNVNHIDSIIVKKDTITLTKDTIIFDTIVDSITKIKTVNKFRDRVITKIVSLKDTSFNLESKGVKYNVGIKDNKVAVNIISVAQLKATTNIEKAWIKYRESQFAIFLVFLFILILILKK